MTAVASPYREPVLPLFARERAIEDELANTRGLLSAYANEHVRISRRVLVGGATEGELAAVHEAIVMLLANEERLAYELTEVRAELVAQGLRKIVAPRGGEVGASGPVLLALMVLVLIAFYGYFGGR